MFYCLAAYTNSALVRQTSFLKAHVVKLLDISSHWQILKLSFMLERKLNSRVSVPNSSN